MTKTEEFEGHTIDAKTHEARKGKWSWTYTIDGEHYHESRDRSLSSEELMMSEAIDSAKALIRHWKATGGPPAREE